MQLNSAERELINSWSTLGVDKILLLSEKGATYSELVKIAGDKYSNLIDNGLAVFNPKRLANAVFSIGLTTKGKSVIRVHREKLLGESVKISKQIIALCEATDKQG